MVSSARSAGMSHTLCMGASLEDPEYSVVTEGLRCRGCGECTFRQQKMYGRPDWDEPLGEDEIIETIYRPARLWRRAPEWVKSIEDRDPGLTPHLNFPRIPSLEAFGRRPRPRGIVSHGAVIRNPSHMQTCANGDRHPFDDVQLQRRIAFAAACSDAGLIRQLATTIIPAAPLARFGKAAYALIRGDVISS